MEIEEHFFAFNPYDGHPDKVTNAPGYNYFFLGNGHIQASIQYNKSNTGSPLGLLIMDPNKFGKKSDAFSYDSNSGLERTIVEVRYNGKLFLPNHENLKVRWAEEKKIPTVIAKWNANLIEIVEEFFCPDMNLPIVVRNIIIKNTADKKVQGEFYIDLNISDKTGYKKRKYQFTIDVQNERLFSFIYSIDKNLPGNVFVEFNEKVILARDFEHYWADVTKINFFNHKFNHLYNSAKFQIHTAISKRGNMDASIWQYNLQWVRDMCNVACGCIVSGQFDLAKIILNKIFQDFISDDGSSLDSGRKRPLREVELDQNGILLYTLWLYWVWTDDIALVKEHWNTAKLVADYLLKVDFWDKDSKMLKNIREYWERHSAFGITLGYELTYQLFPVLGLEKISELAVTLGEEDLAKKWINASNIIKKAFLTDPKYALIVDGHFIKRRKENGDVHLNLDIRKKDFLPEGVPLREENVNLLEPDTSEALPIVFELIDPKSPLAFDTLAHLEKIWNQRWSTGGYARYNVKSEPDSPGPWPFGSMFVARAYLENENSNMVNRILDWMHNLAPEAGSYFEYYGWRPSPPCPPVGIIPWSWAELLLFFVHHFLGIRPEKDRIIIRPKILNMVNRIEARIHIKDIFLNIKIFPKEDSELRYAIIDKNDKIVMRKNELVITDLEKDLNIQLFL